MALKPIRGSQTERAMLLTKHKELPSSFLLRRSREETRKFEEQVVLRIHRLKL